MKVKICGFGSGNRNLRKIRISLIKVNTLKIFLYFAYIYVGRRSKKLQNFCNIPTPKFLYSLRLVKQCIIEGGENDNDMTNRNGVNADAVGQSSF